MFLVRNKISEWQKIFRATAGTLLIVIMLCVSANAQKRTHTIFFENSDHELHIYRIYGEEPGKTLLIIGGIQGDEPGGFLSADLYADCVLAKGNMIVVPRANLYSIVKNRRKINEDMNRKFAEDKRDNYESKVVNILKKLIAESDCLLNLHDGSGFYSEKWISKQRNPKRYGQSIIADCETYVNRETGATLELGKMAEMVIKDINKYIKNPKHHFHFNNHRTKAQDTLHAEQRKSATYYALFTHGIPAFGVETSKSLPLEQKVRQHNIAINAFMKQMGIVPETPGIKLETPKLIYLVISINDSLPVLIEDGQTLPIKKGDTIMLSHIEANYERGLTADIEGYGGKINDLRKKIKITKPAKIIVKKDYHKCGTVYLAMDGHKKTASAVTDRTVIKPEAPLFKVTINGEDMTFVNNTHVKLIKGDTFKINDVFTVFGDSKDLVVNFKGFVGDKKYNTGEDRGFTINTDRDLWVRYSLNKKGKTYPIIVTHKKDKIGKLYVDITTPVMKHLVFQLGDESKYCYYPGDTAVVDIKKPLKLIDVVTNISKDKDVKVYIAGKGISKQLVEKKKAVNLKKLLRNKDGGNAGPENCRIDVKRNKTILGSVYLKLVSGDAS